MGITEAQFAAMKQNRQPAIKKPVKAQTVQRQPNAHLSRFLFELTLLKLPQPETEFRFHDERQWRFDVAWPEQKIAVEYQGIFGKQNASHASLGGLMRDYRKFTEASLLGWTLILIDAESVNSGEAHGWVQRAFKLAQNAINADTP